jgi:hypothetical protein
MNKIILLLATSLFFSGILSAYNPELYTVLDSNYVPLTNSIKHWKELRTNWFNQYEFEYLLGSDTVMSVGQGKKVYLKPYSLNKFIFIGILQEQIAEKKVYFVRTGTTMPSFVVGLDIFPLNTPQILYDFSVNVGDTIPWKPDYHKIVGSIDSIQMKDGTWRRRINFLGDFEIGWVEGMGGLRSLFTSYLMPINSDAFSYLLCFSEVETLQFSAFTDPSICQYFTSTQAPQWRSGYYPNPSSGVVILPFSSDKNYNLDVYDISSRYIQSSQSDGNSVDLQHLNNGIYLIQVNLGNHIEVFKVVIQK